METLLKRRRRMLSMKRYREARKKLEPAIKYLYKEGATEVYLFGSILRPDKFTEHSDIDFAVKGIDEEKHLQIEGTLADILGDLEYDILFLEDGRYIRKEIMKSIKAEAILWKA
jgi:predicted nucleotidyltransferase